MVALASSHVLIMLTDAQVSKVAAQHRTMIEAVENHMPEVVIVVRTAPSCCDTLELWCWSNCISVVGNEIK